ncbi:patatin-like phospholipase family protein [Methylocystis parvus]|uniref:Patatin-like phospholipase family protein n=1 Tax=Methylocystis parvus TaxID=134 RepID=A0A6B8MBP4_9HYPH|nr:patatin-like phospholipase family protein [Methylocystis parvus]QGM98050.1 patatin-like phospholipase family protein [Methylocystis parvus]WBK01631.1 patatin [Methylocystis parvus OBBP]
MARTFEIGLTMAGAVSAGAYTAGVMDFFIEALDAYTEAKKQAGWDGPTHDVRIPIMSGASAGGMTSSICALHFFRSVFDHVWPQDAARQVPERRRNRLYSSWVEDIDISRLLETGDIDLKPGAPVRSLLCCDVIDKIVEDAFDLEGDIRAPEWIGRDGENCVRVRLTLTNMRGVPYAFEIYGAADPRRYGMLNHGDLLDFKIGIDPRPEPGVYALNVRNTKTPDWDLFRTAAKATGAFPIGLSPRIIRRDASQYEYISRIRFGDGVAPPIVSAKEGELYEFVAVDGGTIDNEPLELTRRFLAGGAGRININDGVGTTKAVILIAPFPNLLEATPDDGNAAAVNEDEQMSLARIAATLLSTLTDQARFKPDELRKAADDEYYTRYLISPARDDQRPMALKYPIACGALGGFSGFLHQSFRRHDYLLGRRNAQAFLRWHFVLPETADLFDEFKGDREKWIVREARGETLTVSTRLGKNDLRALPIIPLVGDLMNKEIVIPSRDLPDVNAVFGPARDPLDALIKRRAKAVVSRLVDVHLNFDGFFAWAERKVAANIGTQFAVRKATGKISEAVDDIRQAFYKP